MSEVFFLKYFIIMFNGKSFNEKFLLTRKYYDFTHAINCTHELTCMCVYTRACGRMPLREQYVEVQFLRYGVRQTCFVILSDFCFYISLTTRKIKILKQWKRYLEMPSLYTCVPKITIIWCMLPEIWHMRHILSFWAIFCPFTPLMTPKTKIWNRF